jgi:hypothetical protein
MLYSRALKNRCCAGCFRATGANGCFGSATRVRRLEDRTLKPAQRQQQLSVFTLSDSPGHHRSFALGSFWEVQPLVVTASDVKTAVAVRTDQAVAEGGEDGHVSVSSNRWAQVPWH